jgi:SAM-dependent methyltransferase
VARWWSEFNDDFRPHELEYFRRFLDHNGVPALDAGCGTGRLLLPFLRADLDVDGCDVSADMIAMCREKAAAEGLAPNLAVQAMHELDLPRRYQTIIVCGAFGLGSDRARDAEALRRFHQHLEPGGTLVLDIEVPWANTRQWARWTNDGRESLPGPVPTPGDRQLAGDGSEYALSSRTLELDPLEQRVTLEIHAWRWRDGVLDAEEVHKLDIRLYFPNEVQLMLERAGFDVVAAHGEHTEREPTPGDEFVVFVARKPEAPSG